MILLLYWNSKIKITKHNNKLYIKLQLVLFNIPIKFLLKGPISFVAYKYIKHTVYKFNVVAFIFTIITSRFKSSLT